MLDHDLDDLLAGIVVQHQKLSARVADLEKIEQPIKIHPEVHLQLLGLRGYWPMSSIDENADPYDLGGQGRVLTNHGTILFQLYNLLPYADLTPVKTQYFSRADEAGLDITGSLTLGGWFWLNTLAPGVAAVGLIGKNNDAGNQRAYLLYFLDADNTLRFGMSSLGTSITWVGVTSATVPVTNTWYHIVGRFMPSTSVSIFVDGVRTDNLVGVPASIFNSNTDFEIGAYNAGAGLLDGRACQCFLCSDYLDDVIIRSLFEQTRANFGK